MLKNLSLAVSPLTDTLQTHPIYSRLITVEDLRFFMERHVFAVLDFMSLLNSLKRNLLFPDTLWSPPKNPIISRFLNEITLGEESDIDLEGQYMSHFELYCDAMTEVGANTYEVLSFIQNAKTAGVHPSLKKTSIPESSQAFSLGTFDLIEENIVHKLASSFCIGREKIIPTMFKKVLDEIGISKDQAPKFHFYVERHIEVDGENHGPMSLKLLEILCGQDNLKWEQAIESAKSSLSRRIKFWDDINLEMDKRKNET